MHMHISWPRCSGSGAAVCGLLNTHRTHIPLAIRQHTGIVELKGISSLFHMCSGWGAQKRTPVQNWWRNHTRSRKKKDNKKTLLIQTDVRCANNLMDETAYGQRKSEQTNASWPFWAHSDSCVQSRHVWKITQNKPYKWNRTVRQWVVNHWRFIGLVSWCFGTEIFAALCVFWGAIRRWMQNVTNVADDTISKYLVSKKQVAYARHLRDANSYRKCCNIVCVVARRLSFMKLDFRCDLMIHIYVDALLPLLLMLP